tara:strand:- start:18108 stop:18305 length:198 start_codon:yes stop_codon:yes gene_type:complete
VAKQKENLTEALKDSLNTLTKAWQEWDDLEEERKQQSPYGSMEERLEGEAKKLLKELKDKLDSFS